jgi:hypothetical protein
MAEEPGARPTSVIKVGDRVRLTPRHRHPDYRAGDVGTVTAIFPSALSEREMLYQVHVDGSGEAFEPAFWSDELELVQ